METYRINNSSVSGSVSESVNQCVCVCLFVCDLNTNVADWYYNYATSICRLVANRAHKYLTIIGLFHLCGPNLDFLVGAWVGFRYIYVAYDNDDNWCVIEIVSFYFLISSFELSYLHAGLRHFEGRALIRSLWYPK